MTARREAVGIAVLLLASVCFPAAPAAELAAVAPGAVAWRGFPVAPDLRFGGPVLDLSPDGGSFVYCQGLPWPRLMLQVVAGSDPGSGKPGAQRPRVGAVALGTSAPLPVRAPRFVPDGKRVIFTVDPGWRPARPSPPGIAAENREVRAVVASIGVDGQGETVLAPVGEAADRSAVLLDLHPVGDTALIGLVSGLRLLEARTGDTVYELEELLIPDPVAEGRGAPGATRGQGGRGGRATRGRGGRVPLRFTVRGDSLVRYSWDGRAIYFTPGPAATALRVHRYDRGTGLHREIDLHPADCGALAGDVVVRRARLRHPGSFGGDPYVLSLLSEGLDTPGIALRVPEGFPGAGSGGVRPRSFRGGRVLLEVGPPGTLELVVAEWDPAQLARLLRTVRDPGSPLVTLGARATLGRGRGEATPGPGAPATLGRGVGRGRAILAVRATADDSARVLLDRVHRSIALLPGAPIDIAGVTWEQEAGLAGSRTIDVVETAAGEARIELTRPADIAGAVSPRELVISDGRDGAHVDANGRTARLSRDQLEEQLDLYSPYRLLLDPIGLGEPALHFRVKESAPGDTPDPAEIVLTFRNIDGYEGEVTLRSDAARRNVPIRITTRAVVAAGPAGPGLPPHVSAERTISLDDYRPAGGLLLPHRLSFRDGLNAFTQTVTEVRFNPAVPEGSFRIPADRQSAPAPSPRERSPGAPR